MPLTGLNGIGLKPVLENRFAGGVLTDQLFSVTDWNPVLSLRDKKNMNSENQCHGLWVDGELPPLAELTVRSFLRHHGSFMLWTYNLDMKAPEGTRLRDAAEIIPRGEVFAYTQGAAAGSFGGFSDIFRAQLLFQHGGWWTDMDVTLMQPIPSEFLESPIVLRDHWKNIVVGNVMKFPIQSNAMRVAYELTSRAVNEQNNDWDKPIRLLSRAVRRNRLLKYRHCIGHLDEFVDVLPFVRLPIRIPKDWWAMHWCNEMWRRGHQHLKLHAESHLAELFREYDIVAEGLS